MEDLLRILPIHVVENIKRNPELLSALNREVMESSAYQEGSVSELTETDNHRMAFLVLDYVFKALAYPREIMADTTTGHIYFKAEDGTTLGKTVELENRLDTLFGNGGGSGNDIKVDVDDLISKTLGTSLKELIDLINGGTFKYSVKCATVAPLASLSGLQTIDGVVLSPGDRILVKDQVDKSMNGIYVASAGAWTKPEDFDEVEDVKNGCIVSVGLGTANNNTIWSLRPFDFNSPQYLFDRTNRVIKLKDPAADTSLVIDPIAETIGLKTRLGEDTIFSRVKLTKEGIVKEGWRYDALKTETFTGANLVASSIEQEQIPFINLAPTNKIPCNGTGSNVNFNHRGITTTNTGLMIQKEGVVLKHFLPVTKASSVYLDNSGNTVSDVMTDTPIIEGTSADEFLVFNFKTTPVKMYQFRLMAVLKVPDEIYFADFIFKSENGTMSCKLNEFTESSGRPDIKIYKESVVVDLKNVKSYSVYNSYYGTIYDKYTQGVGTTVNNYVGSNTTNPGALPPHTSVTDLRDNKLGTLESLYSSIGGRLTFATSAEVNSMMDEILG